MENDIRQLVNEIAEHIYLKKRIKSKKNGTKIF